MSNCNKEIELKLCRIGTKDLLQLFEGNCVEDRLEAFYYDTDNLALTNNGLTFRVRLEHGNWVATVKTRGTMAGGLSSRQEYNIVLKEPVATIESFANEVIYEQLKTVIGEQKLELLFKVFVNRRTWEVNRGKSKIELCLDIGRIDAGEKSEEIYELELELKEGSTIDIIEYALELAQKTALRVETKSKFLRGMLLSGLASEQASEYGIKNYNKIRQAACFDALSNLVVEQIENLIITQSAYFKGQANIDDIINHIQRIKSLLLLSSPLIKQQEYIKLDNNLQALSEVLLPYKKLSFINNEFKSIIDNPVGKTLKGNPWLNKKLAELIKLNQENIDSYLNTGALTVDTLFLWRWLYDKPWIMEKQITFDDYMMFCMEQWKDNLLSYDKNLDYNNQEIITKLSNDIDNIVNVFNILKNALHKDELKLYVQLDNILGSIEYLKFVLTTRDIINSFITPKTSRLMYRDIGLLLGWQFAKLYRLQQKLPQKWQKLRKMLKKKRNKG